ncbi:glycosyltransferase family 2 protein [Phocaeicola sartorii]|uniref:glycosyltransferase family 2 protein n=1 Tax=Phocaeicola sartorii TaxID=671267 RepID=UPI00266FD062|nr:glycosyltransferase family 2 protein [Phocaeicola sartorii]
MKNIKIAAVVVTYNRFVLLQKCIAALRDQTHKLDAIIVVDNASTDFTGEWLDKQKDLIVIHQANLGGSGGFHRGIKEAFERKFDWIWTMDDDVNPTPECLEKLLEYISPDIGMLCPQRRMNGVVSLGETLKFNLSNPFVPLKRKLLQSDIKESPIDIEGMCFEGPLISSNTVKYIGLPNRDLFILFDDTDYSYRAVLAGLKVKYIPVAILNKEDIKVQGEGRNWKTVYGLRNLIYFAHTYGKNSFFCFLYPIFVCIRYIVGYFRHFIKFDNVYYKKDLFLFFRAYLDGIRGKLGKY